ncbi:MAG: glycine cleavage system protein GcvH [Candidatus Omnitrophota bacterium]|nr:glycine cleavage system protein GcvH [Candidatus Omnitrophota bacterium]
MDISEGIFYTKEHEWVKVEGQMATVGITAYAQEQLGDITFVELPETEKSVKQFSGLCSIESVKAASDVYAPLSGKVTEVNKELETSPELINNSPFQQGWIAKLEICDLNEKVNLMDSAAYRAFLEKI